MNDGASDSRISDDPGGLHALRRVLVRSLTPVHLADGVCDILVHRRGYRSARLEWKTGEGNPVPSFPSDGSRDQELALPLECSGRCYGTLFLVPLSGDGVPETEGSFLVDLAGDIAHVLERMVPDFSREAVDYEDLAHEDVAHEEKPCGEEDFLSRLLDIIPSPIFYKDTAGRYLGCNRAFENVFGRARNEIVGKTAFDLCPEALALVYHEHDQALLAEGGVQMYETQVKFASGDLRDILFHKAIYTRKSGETAGIVGLMQDITARIAGERERENLQAQLRQAQKMEAIGTLASGIAHDFNNTLSMIIGFSELAMEAEETDRARAHLEEVLRAGFRARDLVMRILAFSRRDEQGVRPVQLTVIVKEMARLLRATLPATIDIRTEMDASSHVMANPVQLHQVLMNLCTNARDAMTLGGALTIRLMDLDLAEGFPEDAPSLDLPPGWYQRLTVVDTGEGMTPQVIDRIFDPFFTTKDRDHGTGLGLSVVHGIVEGLGGTVTVSSTPGMGSRFDVYLPAVVSFGMEHPGSEADPVTGGERILLVDDEAAIARMQRMALVRLGYVVDVHTSPLTALEEFRSDSSRYDLVITDMNMPGMMGDVLVTRLMEIRPDIPIIMCTGYADLISEKKARELGIRAFLRKPALRREIAEAIRQVLDGFSVSRTS